MIISAKFNGTCRACRGPITQGEKISWSRGVRGAKHADCDGQARSILVQLSSGAEIYQNSRGRCEDAPCCGCCS
jgi:hypothetical protein